MNIAEILKYCPKGTKLYSPIFGDVVLVDVCSKTNKYPIKIQDYTGFQHVVTEHGYYLYNIPNSECILFPSKEQRDWNKFRLPIKKGDIMMQIDGTAPFIATGELYENISPKYICGINSSGEFIKYKWNDDTLKLEKIEPKYRPFANREECLQEMLKHQPYGWVKADYGQFIITEIRNSKATIGRNDRLLDFDYIFSKYEFVDGTPFGIKE